MVQPELAPKWRISEWLNAPVPHWGRQARG